MRALILAAFLGLAGVAAAADQVALQPSDVLPHDAATLRSLDYAHLRIVRRARALCWGGFSRSVASRGCIIGETESAIANSHDPVLQAYHKYLPFHARYDEYRPAYYWQRLVQT